MDLIDATPLEFPRGTIFRCAFDTVLRPSFRHLPAVKRLTALSSGVRLSARRQIAHHVRSAAQRADEFSAFLVGEADGSYPLQPTGLSPLDALTRSRFGQFRNALRLQPGPQRAADLLRGINPISFPQRLHVREQVVIDTERYRSFNWCHCRCDIVRQVLQKTKDTSNQA